MEIGEVADDTDRTAERVLSRSWDVVDETLVERRSSSSSESLLLSLAKNVSFTGRTGEVFRVLVFERLTIRRESL